MEPKTPNDILKLMGNKCEEFRNIEQLIQITIFSGGEKNSMLEMAQFIVETVQRILTYLSKPPQISVPHDTTTREVPMDHMCASEVTSLHSDRNDPGNGTEQTRMKKESLPI
ncbi:hypothetical protein JTB14_002662 [Gonioctena quinquepunctata]|nr:hypothetical protein JTB14_002662 [Gonioctena quinquepunctata]